MIYNVLSGTLSLYTTTAQYSVICENIAISYMLPETKLFGLHFCCRQYGSILNYFDLIKYPPDLPTSVK